MGSFFVLREWKSQRKEVWEKGKKNSWLTFPVMQLLRFNSWEMPLPKLRCKQDRMPKSIVQILFNIKCEVREIERDRKKRRRKRDTVRERQVKQKDNPTRGSRWHPFGPLYPGLLSGEGPKVIQNFSLSIYLYSHSSISRLSLWVMVTPWQT